MIEIGCEELPALVQESAARHLMEVLRDELKERGFETGDGRSFATPRRIATVLEVSPFSKILEDLKLGPPLKIAYDAEGRPTKALLKFLERWGLGPEDVVEVKGEKGQYVGVRVKRGGEFVGDVLGDILEKYVKGVPLPKRMRWDDSGLTFIRPIRWLVAMLEEEVLPVRLGKIVADRITYTARFPTAERVEIPSAGDYETLLEERGVIPDFSKRLSHVRSQVERFFPVNPEDYELYETDVNSLLYEITGLVEKGYAVYGNYNREFLKELYPEVITAAMVFHQRYVPHIENSQLKAGFVAFSNNPKGLTLHKRGYENVLRARLNDALFYKREDLKRDLAFYVENLKSISWIRGLGTLYDRMLKVKRLSLSMPLPEGVDRDVLEFVATHYLFDTATSMIRDGKEFTKLEGRIGYYYAREILTRKWGDEEKAERYALGIYEARLPKGKKFPTTLEGLIVAVADALTTVDGLLSIDYKWSSSRDPLGIRMQIRRFVSLLMYPVSGRILGRRPLHDFLRLTETYGEKEEVWYAMIEESLTASLAWVLSVVQPDFYPRNPSTILFTYDGKNLFLSAVKARAYENVIVGENEEKFATILKRLRRIFTAKPKKFLREDDPQRVLAYEKALEESVNRIEGEHLSRIRGISPEGESPRTILKVFEDYLKQILNLYGVLDRFFAEVPVMVQDERVRERRMALLRRALDLIDEILPRR